MTYHNAGAQAVWHRHYRSLQRAFTIYAGSSDSSSHVSKPKAALMNKAEWLRLLQVQYIVCERAQCDGRLAISPVCCNAACARLVAPQHGRLLDYGDLTREDAVSVFARVQHGEALLSLSTATLASTAVAIDAEIGRTVLVAADSNRSMHPSEAAGSKALGDRASSAATVADQVYASTDGTGAAVAPDESRHSALRRNPATEVLLVH